MTDLIWIGNTLYPRWFVIAVVALVFCAIVFVPLAIRYVAMKIQYRRRGDM